MAKASPAPYVRVFSEMHPDAAAFEAAVEEVRVVAQVFASDARLKAFLLAPDIPRQRREQALRAALKKAGASELVGRFLAIMARKNQQHLFAAFAVALREAADRRLGVLRGIAESAVEVEPALRRRLEQVLAARTGQRIVLAYRTHGELLGGLRVRIGMRVLDGSLARKVQEVRFHLLAKQVS